MRALLVLSSIFLCQSFGQECSPPLPAECADTEIRCDMGTNGGCWMGDYCMQEGDYCPPPCHTPLPSQCMEGEVACDMGTVGGEITAFQREITAPHLVTVHYLFNVRRETLPVTLDLMEDVGVETTACQKALTVFHHA